MSTHDTTIRVVILGGGYADVIATNRFLGSLTNDERRRAPIPLTAMLLPAAALVTGTARYIDYRARTVRVSAADRELDLSHDYLVYAIGSTAAAPIPGSREHTPSCSPLPARSRTTSAP